MLTVNVQVNKKVKDEVEPRHAEFPFQFPDSVTEAISAYGEDVTLRLVNDAITLLVQGPARKILEALPQESDYSAEVSKQMADFKVTMKRTRSATSPKISPYQVILNGLADPSQRDEIVERFRSMGINLDLNSNDSNGLVEESTEPTPSNRRVRS